MVLAEVEQTKNVSLREEMRRAIVSLKMLKIEETATQLAEKYILNGAIPAGYPEDALHVAIATSYGMEYLLSWNFEHLIKVKTRKIVSMVNVANNYPDLQIITPPELIS